jgi:hypothetical protein
MQNYPSVPKLLDAILEGWTRCLLPPYGDGEFTPTDGVTDCNRFVAYVADKMGYKRLADFRANAIHDFIAEPSNGWSKVSSFSAGEYANRGCLVIAAWKNPNPNLSGHVAIVRPGNLETSSKWKYDIPTVPKVANVGPLERCRIDRAANWAFGDEPSYFVLNTKD